MALFAMAPLVAAASWTASYAAPPNTIGVVVLHGKGGSPRGAVARFASRLRSAGFRVAVPDMPWSRGRGLNRDVAGSLAEISAIAARLRSRGASRIVIAGHSLGSPVALAYSLRNRVAGLVLLAPGHFNFGRVFQRQTNFDWRRAQNMVRAGQGNRTSSFRDTNQGRTGSIRTTARIYASWFNPTGPASMRVTLRRLRRGTPVLWVSGSNDRLTQIAGRLGVYRLLARNPSAKRVTVSAGHMGVPSAATRLVIDWLKAL